MSERALSHAEKKDREGRGGRWLAFVLALLLGMPLLVLGGLTLVGPPTWETALVTLSGAVMVVGGLAAPWSRAGLYSARLAFLVIFAVVVYRFFATEATPSISSPSNRWMDRIVPERDVAIGGSNLLIATGRMGGDSPGLLDALRDGYDRMRAQEGPVPSAVVSTFVLGQSAESHSVFRVAPPSRFAPPEGVVVFLHGFIGNVTLECWEVAQAANPVGVDVVCPSADWQAQWTSPAHRQTVSDTIAQLRAEGVRRIYLAGLSAGSIGASRLAPSLDIDGLILISGASRQASPARVPTLILQGRRDSRTRPGPARAYARAAGSRAQYEEHPTADHWMILSEHEWCEDHIRRWLQVQEGLEEIEER
ncbi:MAG: alpha/beta hydrolase [Sandaracinaceae bacterium]